MTSQLILLINFCINLFVKCKSKNELFLDSSLTLKDLIRIARTRKSYAVYIGKKLHLVNDIDRLFLDRLKANDIYKATIYYLKE